MKSEKLERYNQKRQSLIAAYRKKKLINLLAIFGAGAVLLVTVALLQDVLNIAVTLVLGAMIVMITVIFARIRAVTINHTLQSQLRLYEQEEPDFHVNFKK